jgi:hypothetical protein
MGAIKSPLFLPTNDVSLGGNKYVNYLEELLEIIF